MSPPGLSYEPLERIRCARPVDRLSYIPSLCRDKTVLDIGCLDETALVKRDTVHWLHGRIAAVARRVIGVDASTALPAEGLQTAVNARIVPGNGLDLSPALLSMEEFEVVVAGEFIEHIPDPVRFLRNLRAALPGRRLVLSTPNGVCFANTLMGAFGMEIQHPDHVANYTYKILHTLCLRAQLTNWEIRPYRFYATETILKSRGAKRLAAIATQSGIRVVERLFPLLSFGYIVDARL